MTIRSDIVFLFLVLASSGALANECEQDGSSVIEVSTCLSCGGCYNLVESSYNKSLEAHVNFTAFYEHFLNLSQLNIPQLLDRYQAMLRVAHSLSVETANNERNVTLQLSIIANATTEANKLLDTLKRNLSSAMNGSRTARLIHNNSMAILRELDMLVNSIGNIISHNITVTSNRTASINDQILTKLELLASTADNTSNISRQQENLATVTKLTAEEAHNISVTAFEALCQAIELHNATIDLVRQLNSQDTVNITILQQQINADVILIQQTLSEHNVFNTSQQLIDKVANISVPSYNIMVVESMVDDVFQNVSELFNDATESLDRLEVLEEQAGDLNDTAEELLQRGRELKEEADMLFMTLNESFLSTRQNISEAESYFNDITVLHDNLTAISRVFNDSIIADVVTRLEDEDAENVRRVAYNSSVGAQEDLERIWQLLSETNKSLTDSTNQLTDHNLDLTMEIEGTRTEITEIQGGIDITGSVMDDTEVEWINILEVNKTTTNQSSQLIQLNSTASTIQDRLELLEQELRRIKDHLKNLTNMLESLEFTEVNNGIGTAQMKVELAGEAVRQNNELLDGVMKKMNELKDSSDELEDKYKQLKQHRDLLRQILSNIGDNTCVN